jgi:hypothetical protein
VLVGVAVVLGIPQEQVAAVVELLEQQHLYQMLELQTLAVAVVVRKEQNQAVLVVLVW